MGSTLALSSTRCLTVHDATSCLMENYPHEGGQSYDKLAPPGHDHLFDITAPSLCQPRISDVVATISVIHAHQLRIARPMCDGLLFASSPPCRLGSRSLLFSAYHHQPYPESVVTISSQVLLYAMRQDVS